MERLVLSASDAGYGSAPVQVSTELFWYPLNRVLVEVTRHMSDLWLDLIPPDCYGTRASEVRFSVVSLGTNMPVICPRLTLEYQQGVFIRIVQKSCIPWSVVDYPLTVNVDLTSQLHLNIGLRVTCSRCDHECMSNADFVRFRTVELFGNQFVHVFQLIVTKLNSTLVSMSGVYGCMRGERGDLIVLSLRRYVWFAALQQRKKTCAT